MMINKYLSLIVVLFFVSMSYAQPPVPYGSGTAGTAPPPQPQTFNCPGSPYSFYTECPFGTTASHSIEVNKTVIPNGTTMTVRIISSCISGQLESQLFDAGFVQVPIGWGQEQYAYDLELAHDENALEYLIPLDIPCQCNVTVIVTYTTAMAYPNGVDPCASITIN